MSSNIPEKEVTSGANNYDEMLWAWNLHEDGLLANRANFILVAESMFFTAFAALAINSKSVLPIILGIAGIFLNIIWMKMSEIQLNHTTQHLRELIVEKAKEGKSPFLKKYSEISGKRPHPTITEFIRIWIPLLLIITWVFLIIFYILYILTIMTI